MIVILLLFLAGFITLWKSYYLSPVTPQNVWLLFSALCLVVAGLAINIRELTKKARQIK